MTQLSQRAVDCSIKAYALNSIELCREVLAMEDKLCELELCIGDRGRALLGTGTMIDSHSNAACSLLRIYSSHRVIFMAAAAIAQSTSVLATQDRATSFSRTIEAGDLVNCLIGLCSIAFFEEQKTMAESVFKIEGGRKGVELALCRARIDLLRRVDKNCRCEIAIANCIGQIAEQVYEIAEHHCLARGQGAR
jgi:uncharacterized protein with PhoU and TrkA domain